MLPHLNGDDEDVERVRLLRCGHGFPLALQFAHVHPFPAEHRVVTLCAANGDEQNVAMTIFDWFIVYTTQVVSSQHALQGNDTPL